MIWLVVSILLFNGDALSKIPFGGTKIELEQIQTSSKPPYSIQRSNESHFRRSPSEGDEISESQIRFENFSIEDGLSQNTVTSILQDGRGFLWFGTEDGINKYDGYEFSVFRHDPEDPWSISDNSVLSIYEDQNQTLWIGTYGRGLNKFDPISEHFTHYRHDPDNPRSISGDSVTSIQEDADGHLWVGTSNGLSRFDPDSHEFINYHHDPGDQTSLGGNHISDLLLDQNSNLWIGTFGGGLQKYLPDSDDFLSFQQISGQPNSISSDLVTSICEGVSGKLWIGTQEGTLNFFDPDLGKFYSYNYSSDDGDPRGIHVITSIEVDQNGLIWVGSNSNGINILDPKTGIFQNLSHDLGDPKSLSSDLIYSILKDRSGMMWVGTSGGGVDRFDPSTGRFIHHRHISSNPDSLSANNVQTIVEDQVGNLWVGVYGGGLNYLDNSQTIGKIIQYRHDPQDPFSLSTDDVSSVFVDSFNDVWVGTTGGGLNRYFPPTRKFTHYRHDPENPESIASDMVSVIFEDRNGFLWVGTNGAGLDRFDRRTSNFYHFKNDPDDPASLSHDQIRVIMEDRTGKLWIGTGGGGISVLDQGTSSFSHFLYDPAISTSLGDADVLAIYEDQKGTIWIGTNGSGLDQYDPVTGNFSHYRTVDGLPNNVVHGILEDQQGNLWLSTNFGISKFNPLTKTFKNYDVSDGLQSNAFNSGASFLASNEMMYFGGINGLTAFNPQDIRDSTDLPPVVFTGLWQSGEDLLHTQSAQQLNEIVLNWSNNNLEFEFVALNFAHPEKVRYAYKLEDFDNDWNYIGASRSGRYTNLPAGTYTLRIRATNSDGYWNEEGSSLEIRVVPPFWETWWFIGLVTVIIMGSVISAYRLRIRSVESRSQELENLVQLRTKEIDRRRLEMESLYQADEIIDQHLTQQGRLKALVDVSIDLLNAENSVILLREGDSSEFKVSVARGFRSSGINMLSIPADYDLVERAVKFGEVVVIHDVRGEVQTGKAAFPYLEYLITEGVRSSIFLPIRFGSDLPVLFNVNFSDSNAVSGEQLRVFKILAQHSSLSIQNAQLFEQLRELAISEERSRLARDLHDSAKQKAFAALAQLGAASGTIGQDPTASKEHLLEAEDLVYEVLQELIILIQEMYPVALQEKGLANSIREYIYDWENQCNVDVDLIIKDERDLSLEIEQSLYRVVQESLANIARHSQARRVEIKLVYALDHVRVEIHDDGVGFDVAEQPSGLGLRSMKERIDLVSGELKILSDTKNGTSIRVEVPLNPV